MDLNHLEEVSLEYLSSQIEPIDYGLMYTRILEENELSLEDLRVPLWLRLYSNKNVLILVNDEFEEYIRSHFPVKSKRIKKNIYDIDINSIDPESLGQYVDNSRLICSNSYRIKSLNLVLYEHVTKTSDRFRLLMSIASKRYSGCWQSDLVEELKISPREIFSQTNSLCKLGLVCKLSIPQNRISKYLLNNINSSSLIKFDTNEESQDSERDVTPRVSKFASVYFFNRYFVIDKLPKHIRTCFGEDARNYDASMLEALEAEENNILLESDWKCMYFNMALKEVSIFNTKLDNYVLSRSYLSFRKSMELKNKIALIFAWCPQTKKFERCIMLIKNQTGHPLKVKNSNVLHVINLKNEGNAQNDDSDDEPSSLVPFNPNRHSIHEYIYYIIKHSRNGITTKDINSYVPIKYRQLSKMVVFLESTGLFKKETVRDGKLFMYRYFTSDHKRRIVKTEEFTDHDTSCSTGLGTGSLDGSGSGTTGPLSAESSQFSDKNYTEFVNSQKSRYLENSDYLRDFDSIYGNIELPKQSNTFVFKSRMVLMKNYLDYFKAATYSNISNFYSDMEDTKTKVDRKTVMRVSEFVLKVLNHFKRFRCEELKGANLSLTILFDSRHFNQTEAYKYIRNYINMRKNLFSIHGAMIRTKIKDHFKDPEAVDGMQDHSVDIVEESPVADDLRSLKFPIPCLVRNVSVNQQNLQVKHDTTNSFSQRILSLNGYIFPIMTRAKMLHSLLVENFMDCTFTTAQVLQVMSLGNYFQLIGCGYIITDSNVYANEKIDNLPIKHKELLLNKRRDPINILNNQLNFLYRIKLLLFLSGSEPSGDAELNGTSTSASGTEEFNAVEDDLKDVEVVKNELNWKVVNLVDLYDFVNNQNLGKYDLRSAFDLYWQHFKVQVDNYISSGLEGLPQSLPVKEVFVKKNWKTIDYLSSSVKFELDRVVSIWLSLCCNGLHYKSLAKLLYIPHKILNLLTSRFNLTNTQIQSYLLTKIKYNRYESQAEDDQILNKILSNIHKDTEILWISRYVISEKLLNQIFFNMLNKNCCLIGSVSDNVSNHDLLAMIGDLNGLPDIWKYIHILFEYKYNVNECKIIFDYIMNKSSFNLRVLKKLRKMRTKDIVRYIANKSYTTITSTYNAVSTNDASRVGWQDKVSRPSDKRDEQLCNLAKLKWMLFASTSEEVSQGSNPYDLNHFRQTLKSWSEYGWVVKTKKRTNLFKTYKLSILSKLKLFPKYSTFYHMAKQFLSYVDMYTNTEAISVPYYGDTNLGQYQPAKFMDTNTNPNLNGTTGLTNHHVIKDCLELDYHKVYNILENFNIVQFEAKMYYKPNKGSILKPNYSRLIEGGISKHINSMTNSLSIGELRANISKIHDKLGKYNYSQWDLGKRVVPKLMLCEHDSTDIINPSQFVYAYSNRNFNTSTVDKFEFNSLSDLISYVMNQFNLDYDIVSVEKLLFSFVDVVKKSKQAGINYTRLKKLFDPSGSNSSSIQGMFRDKNLDAAGLLKVVIYVAAILRVIVMVPNGAEFLYLYWEFNQDLLLNHEGFNVTEIQKPDYVSNVFWLIWERGTFSLSRDSLDSFIGHVRGLLPTDLDSYFQTLKGSFYGPFVTINGHLNTHLVGFISLRIFSIVRDKPGITVQQIWKDMVILDQCEVEILVESLVMLNMLTEKEIKLDNRSVSGFKSDKGRSDGAVHKVYYPQDTSLVLWKFRNIFFTN